MLLVTLIMPVGAPRERAGGDVPKAAAPIGPRLAWTPFTSTRAGEVIVPVAIGGRGPFRFLLDTGSTHTAVTGRVAAAVGGVPVARTVMTAAAGPVDCVVIRLPQMIVGTAATSGITATVLPAAATGVLHDSLDGVLGQDFLAGFDFTIDYPRRRIEWHDAGYAPSGIHLALVPAGDRWLVELPHPTPCRACWPEDRQRPHRFVPDSGADAIVLFDEARAGALVAEWHPGGAALHSLTGARTARTATIVALRVGDTFLDRQTAAIVPAPSPDGADGLLPLHLFARVFVSARSRALVVQPR
jgi:hypothetical protein